MKSVKIGDIFKITSGGTPNRDRRDYYENGNIPWVKTGDLKNKYLYQTSEFINEAGLQNSSAKIFPKNTVLIALYGATIGACSILKISAATNQACAALLPTEKVKENYLYYYLNYIKPKFISLAVGGAQPNISSSILKSTLFPLPPLDVQKKIATVLDKADSLRQKRREAIEKLDQLVQSVFLNMFGDPEINRKGWEIKTLSEVTTLITDGVHAKPNYVREGVPFISVLNITTGRLDFNNCKFISVDDHKKFSKRCRPEYLDILYTKVGATYGRPALVDIDKEFSIYVSVALIKPQHKIINPYFLKETLANVALKKQADKAIKGIGVPDLHLIEIKKFKIPLPPMELQQKFVEITKKINEERNELKKFSTYIDNLFNSLLQKAFRGDLKFNDRVFAELEEAVT